MTVSDERNELSLEPSIDPAQSQQQEEEEEKSRDWEPLLQFPVCRNIGSALFSPVHSDRHHRPSPLLAVLLPLLVSGSTDSRMASLSLSLIRILVPPFSASIRSFAFTAFVLIHWAAHVPPF